MQYIDRYLVGSRLYYAVYNSQGDLALITSNSVLAHFVAESFEQNPHTRQIKVRDLDPNRVKRR